MTHQRLALLLISGFMVAGGVITTLSPMDRAASLEAVAQVFSDVMLDADQAGLQLTRVSTTEENEFGKRMGEAVENNSAIPADLTRYVSEIGNRLTLGVERKGIFYRFRVIDSPMVNAFALPGGYVFVYRGLIDKLDNEAQLAAVLGHEIAHIDLRHCVERYQYRLKLKEMKLPADVGALADFARGLGVQTYSQQQELAADAHGWKLAVDAGYDPDGARSLMARFEQLYGAPVQPQLPNSPVQESAVVLDRSFEEFWRSHPPSARRAQALRQLIETQRASLVGREYCIGRSNLRERVTCLQRRTPDEIVKFR